MMGLAVLIEVRFCFPSYFANLINVRSLHMIMAQHLTLLMVMQLASAREEHDCCHLVMKIFLCAGKHCFQSLLSAYALHEETVLVSVT